MRLLFALTSVLLVSSAFAKPLPTGMSVALKKGRPHVTANGTTVPLSEATLTDWDTIKVELSDDGAAITVEGARCKGKIKGEATRARLPLAAIEARLDNAAGKALLGKKQLPAAISKLASAVAKDPTSGPYVTDLVIAQLRAGKLDDADKTLATAGKHHLAWIAWRLVVDPALKPLKARPSVAMFAAKTRGKARSVTLSEAFAYSALGMVATRTASGEGGSGAEVPMEVSFTDITTGREDLRLPMATETQRKFVDEMLQTLGFNFDGMFTDIRQGRSLPGKDDRAILVSGEGGPIKWTRPGASKPVDFPGVIFVGIAPVGAVFLQREEHLFRCTDASYRTTLRALPDP